MEHRETDRITEWALVELKGFVQVYGRLTEEEHFGCMMGRIDVPTGDGPDEYITQWFHGSSVYRITPSTEEICRESAGYRPRRIGRYTAPLMRENRPDGGDVDEGGDGDEEAY